MSASGEGNTASKFINSAVLTILIILEKMLIFLAKIL